MKVIIENPPPGGEEEIIIRAYHLDERITELIQRLKTDSEKLTGYHSDGSISLIRNEDIFYFESVDNKVFAYSANDVTELKLKLYELERRFSGTDLIRISKSMILNLSKVSRFAPSVSGRFEAILLNGEKVIISRQYVPDIKKRLGL